MENNGSSNGFSTATEYIALSRRRLVLPSGAVFLVRRQNVLWTIANMPASMREAADRQRLGEAPEVEQLRELQLYRSHMIEESVLSPKINLTPNYSENEISPHDLTPADADRIIDYLEGRVDEEGRPLEGFRSDSAAAGGDDRRAVPQTTE
jgi:hypothetical protein